MDVLQSLIERRSTRAFLPREVPRDVLTRIFEGAQKTPSWCNIQPWQVWVASGAKRDALCGAFVAAAQAGEAPDSDVPFPFDYPEPYASRRRECGKALYEAMGVSRADHAGKQAAWLRNFAAFDAPHVAIVGYDRRFDLYAALDLGCWLESVLLLATSEGVATCAQASLAVYPKIARAELGIPDEVKIFFGIGLGYEDPTAKANACRTTREPLDANVRFV